MQGYIQVSTQTLREKETEWLGLCSRIQSAFQAGVEELEKVEQSFQAEPIRNVREQFPGLLEEGDQVFGRLHRHIGKLSKIAAVYETAERENINVFCEN